MPRRSRKPNSDPNKAAADVVGRLTGQEREKNPAAVALGRLGGAKGGKARAASLTKEERSDIARRAAEARWKNAE